ncbi:hypothetical protein [Actibacterium sp. XHP0104]|uniref:hypothetical protein n=1 Tax=Actibacterium sp. XHP0104 TaxID=2984335 RepID=UPI0021E984AB|nr:hypothetical protein [Actibacterium sp. XHP0104]MCV2881759.1 hypothetical protein [Actibacterium sp. XHP0104]
MRFTLAITLISFALLGSPPALADPWLRADGAWFATISHETEAGHGGSYDSAMVEWGLSPGVTLGLDIGLPTGGDAMAVAYTRLPLGQATGRPAIAAELGAGTKNDGQAFARVGLAIGQGIETGLGDGWWSLDGRADMGFDNNSTGQMDATAGLHLSDRGMVILQLQGGAGQGIDSYVNLAPSYAHKFGDGTHIELGLTTGLIGDRGTGVKLGSWLSF